MKPILFCRFRCADSENDSHFPKCAGLKYENFKNVIFHCENVIFRRRLEFLKRFGHPFATFFLNLRS